MAARVLDKIAVDDPWDWRVEWYRGLLALQAGAPAQSHFDVVVRAAPGELAPQLATSPGPLDELPVKWGPMKSSRRSAQALCEITPGVAREELERLVAAFGGSPFGIAPTLTLHGLVRHMAEVERDWLRICFAGQAIGNLYSTAAWPTADFDDLESADPATDFATFAEEVRLARAVTVGRALDDTFVHPQRHIEINLRWVYIHMIEEYARHNGHADLLRERIDGTVGV